MSPSPSPTKDRSLTPLEPAPLVADTHALGLSAYDRSAITGFVAGDPGHIDALIDDCRQLAAALAANGPPGDRARVRLLARTAAACRTQLRLLEGLLAQRVAARDFEAVSALNKTLDGVAKRMTLMVKHLAVESALRSRPTVTLKRMESVEISGSLP